MANETTTQAPSLLRTLGTLTRNDVRLIGRNSFIAGVAGFSLIMAVIMRFGLPWLAEQIAAKPELELDAASFFPLLVGYIIVFQAALLGGIMIGFILLDERDNRTIQALLVTPLQTGHYLLYRVLVAVFLAWVLVIVEMLIVNQAVVPLPIMVVIAAVAALVGALGELFLATLAGNKVEGFAQLKIISGSGLLLFVAWFLPEPWQFLVGLYPPYWGVKAYWLAQAGNPYWIIALVIGAIYCSGVIFALVRRFNQVVHNAA